MMIARGFRPVVWVFMIGVAVLGCYMLNLRVASERAELAKLDRRIVATQQSIRALQTEVGTRSRIPQLEEWNDDVLALSAPASTQYLQQNVSLARFDTRQPQLSDQAEVRLASAETGDVARPEAVPAPAPATTAIPAPQRAIAPAPVAARPEVRRASLLIAPEAPAGTKPREAAAPPRRDTDRVVRIAVRDDVRPGPRDERARPVAARPDRVRPGPGSADARRPAPVRTAARDDRRPAPGRATVRAAAAPGAAGRVLAAQRPASELRKDERSDRRRSTRD
jgi:hypothetical protein